MAVSVKGHTKRDRRMGQFVYAFDPDHPIRGIYVSYFSGKNSQTQSTLKKVIQARYATCKARKLCESRDGKQGIKQRNKAE